MQNKVTCLRINWAWLGTGLEWYEFKHFIGNYEFKHFIGSTMCITALISILVHSIISLFLTMTGDLCKETIFESSL